MNKIYKLIDKLISIKGIVGTSYNNESISFQYRGLRYEFFVHEKLGMKDIKRFIKGIR